MLRAAFTLTVGAVSQVHQGDAVVIARHTIMPQQPGMYAPNIIDATIKLCEEDARVRAYLFGLARDSVYLNLGAACVMMCIGILANHNLIPPLFMPAGMQASPNDSQNGTANGHGTLN
jgi:hypothetical protein